MSLRDVAGMNRRGRSVKLFLADGSNSGIVTAEIGNWSGHILSAPRTRLEDAILRNEVTRTGVYILYAQSTHEANAMVYVGEADEVKTRLISHDKEKDFWERFVVITSKDANLTKAHVRYLEARILDIIHEVKAVNVVNKTNPSFDNLPEADISDMESFLDEIKLALPVLGFDFLKVIKVRDRNTSSTGIDETRNLFDDDAVFLLKNAKAGIDARATEQRGEFIVLEGSKGSLKEKSSFLGKPNKSFRDDLLESGRIEKIDEKNFVFKQDVAFSSPSAASVCLFGTSRNGRTDWTEEQNGLTYADWKDGILLKHLELVQKSS